MSILTNKAVYYSNKIMMQIITLTILGIGQLDPTCKFFMVERFVYYLKYLAIKKKR